MEQKDYQSFGVNSLNSNSVKLNLLPGSRLYLLGPDGNYQMFKLKNKEISIDVDLSTLPCGVNTSLYLVEMQKDGGIAASGGKNKAGAKFGTGYCDAQCFKSKWLNTGASTSGQ